jgi:hypothetical protein
MKIELFKKIKRLVKNIKSKKPVREWNFNDEGILWRKGGAIILKPKGKKQQYEVRVALGKLGKPHEEGECDLYDRKLAFEAGNRLAKLLSKKKKK